MREGCRLSGSSPRRRLDGRARSIRARVRACEAEEFEILCCPEAILGGLADQIEDPARVAICIRTGQLEAVWAPLASDVTTTIIGFTELGEDGFLYKRLE